MIIYSLLLIVLMLTRPQGLFQFYENDLPAPFIILKQCPPLLQLDKATIRFGGLRQCRNWICRSGATNWSG